MPGDRLSIFEAAGQLGVSRRRAQAMVLKGQLPAERIGHQWVVSAASVRAVGHNRWDQAGRPMAHASAWKFLNDQQAFAVVGRADEFDCLRRRLRSRARHRELYVHPSMLRRLSEDPRLVIGGRAAADFLGVPVDEGSAIDVYAHASDEAKVVSEFAARESFDRANLHLHVVDDDAWPFLPEQKHVEGWVAWLDLADSQDRAADTLFDRLAGGRPLA